MDAQLSMDLDAIIAANKQAKRSVNSSLNKRSSNNNNITHSTRSTRSSNTPRSSRNGGGYPSSSIGGNAGGALVSASAAKRQVDQLIASTGANKISINNLHYGVTESDIAELFGRVGRVKKVQLFYDAHGKSMGTANIVFITKEDAMAAIKKFNGVALDGRVMQIEAVVPPSTLDAATKAVLSATRNVVSSSGPSGGRGSVGKAQPRNGGGNSRRSAQGSNGRSGGGAGSRRSREPRQAVKTEVDLDRELLDYMGHSVGTAPQAALADVVVGDAMQMD